MQLGIYNKVVKEQPIINLQYMYDNIDQLEIYRYYLGYYPNDREFYKSPFSSDTNPSLRFKVDHSYKLIYKCFSTGKTGDCITLVKELFSNLNFQQILNKIVYDVQGNKISNKVISFQNSIKNANLDITRRSEIQVILFDKEPISFLNYWKRFYIDSFLLKLYDVKAAKTVLYKKDRDDINEQPKPIKFYKDSDIIIRYLVNGEYKIYKPLTKNKKDKWLSTFDYRCIFGFSQLDYSLDTIIISKSSKDVLVWRLLGYNAISLPTEASRLWKEFVDYLRSKFKYVICILDNDKAGVTSMWSYKELWGIDYIVLPEGEERCKDLAEIIETESIVYTQSLVNVLIKEKIKTINNK
jgi:hypothetical protein